MTAVSGLVEVEVDYVLRGYSPRFLLYFTT